MRFARERKQPIGVIGHHLTLAVVMVLLTGCSENSFLSRRFDDFTAHYNKFYNANRTFQEQERKLLEGDKKIDTDRYLPVFELPEQRGRSTELEKVITKCADLLRNHPRSKWVDDALMLIGKSYFYQSNFVGAEQKFKEIINLDGKLKDEAEFWLARTLVAGQSLAAAEDIIGAALAEEDIDKEWRSLFLLLRGDLRTREGLWQPAIDDIEAGVRDVKNGDTAARAYFLLGQLYETDGQFEESARAYAKVQDKKPLYELSYAAMMGEVRALGLHVDPEEALRRLERMMRDNKHFQNRHALQYMYARVLAAAGDPLAARESFFAQLYPDDPSRRTSLRGEVHYRLGELYRDDLGDFYRAGIHFDTASTVIRTAPAKNELMAPDAIVDARETASTFREFRETHDQLARMDSLLYLGSLDKAAFDSAVAVVRLQLSQEAARIQAELDRRRTESRFRQAAAETALPTTQTGPGATAANTYGFLNHRDLQRVQEAYLGFKERWGDRPLVPGWRREEAILVAQRQPIDGRVNADAEGQAEAPNNEVRFLPAVDVSEVPRDSASRAHMRAERAEARYRLANVLFLSIGLPDSAAKWYRLVIDEDSDLPVAHRALYAMAEVHEALGDEAASRRTFEAVVDRYPDSEFAVRARARLGLPAAEELVPRDTLELATARYEAAYDDWKRGADVDAINAMVRTAADFPKTEIAAKALLAVARIYLEKANRDSLDHYGPISLRDSVFSEVEIEAAIAAAAPPSEQVTARDTAGGEAGNVEAVPGPLTKPDQPGAATTAPDSAKGDDVATTDVSTLERRRQLRNKERVVARDKLEPRPERDETSPETALRDEGEELALKDPRPHVVGEDEEIPAVERTAPPDTAMIVAKRTEPVITEPAEDHTEVVENEAAPTDSLTSVPTKAPSVTDPAPAAKPERPPPPEIEWIKPEYFVKGLIPVPLTLHSLYGAVADNFASTPYGKRAIQLRRGLEAMRTALAVAELEKVKSDAGEAVTPSPANESTGPGGMEEEVESAVEEPPVSPDSVRTTIREVAEPAAKTSSL